MKKGLLSGILVFTLSMFFVIEAKATLIQYTDRSAWEAAAGLLNTEDFDAIGYIYISAATGPVAINSDFSIEDLGTIGTYIDSGGFYHSRERNPSESSRFIWNYGITAFGGDFNLAGPGGSGSGLNLIFSSGDSDYISGNTNGFVGWISDTAFVSVTFSDPEPGSPVETWEFDNMGYSAPTAAPVPEPSTIILMGIGLIGMVGYGRKRFSKKG